MAMMVVVMVMMSVNVMRRCVGMFVIEHSLARVDLQHKNDVQNHDLAMSIYCFKIYSNKHGHRDGGARHLHPLP